MNGKITEKQINSHLSELNNEEELIRLRIQTLTRELEQKQKTKNKLKTKAEKIKARTPVVSEHAMLRWLERIGNMDIEDIQNKILDPKVLELIEKLGPNGTYPHPDGYSLVFKNKVCVTIVKK